MLNLTRQQTVAVAAILSEIAPRVHTLKIEEIKSETLKGSVAITATFPGSRPLETHIVNPVGQTVQL